MRLESRRRSVGFLILHDPGDIHELQAGLVGKRGQRTRERLRRNIGDELRRFRSLCKRNGDTDESSRRANRGRTEHLGDHCRDLPSRVTQVIPHARPDQPACVPTTVYSEASA